MAQEVKGNRTSEKSPSCHACSSRRSHDSWGKEGVWGKAYLVLRTQPSMLALQACPTQPASLSEFSLSRLQPLMEAAACFGGGGVSGWESPPSKKVSRTEVSKEGSTPQWVIGVLVRLTLYWSPCPSAFSTQNQPQPPGNRSLNPEEWTAKVHASLPV